MMQDDSDLFKLPSDVESRPAGLPTDEEIFKRLTNLWGSSTNSLPVNRPAMRVGANGRFKLIREVGRGGFGVVYLARDLQKQREVAIKLPRPEVILDEEKLRRFEREASTAAALSHPGIVPIYEANLLSSPPYIATAFCSGPDLAQWLDNRRVPVSAKQAAAFVIQVIEAVEYIHEKGILHRDLKPANIMLESSGENHKPIELTDYVPRLTDFGLSKIIEDSIQETRASLLIGTPIYMAPEQLSSELSEPIPETDIYALGIVLFELLTLRTPFQGTSYIQVLEQVRSREPQKISKFNSGVPVELDTICQKALSKDPHDRYRTATQFKEDLQRFLAGRNIQARPTTWFVKIRRWCQQPERIRQAGRFACWIQLANLFWTMSQVTVISLSSGTEPEVTFKNIRDLFFVAGLVTFSQVILGLLTANGKRWAFWLSAFLSVIGVGFVAYSMAFLLRFLNSIIQISIQKPAYTRGYLLVM